MSALLRRRSVLSLVLRSKLQGRSGAFSTSKKERGFPAGSDVGDVLKPSSEVDPNEMVLVSGDGSVAKVFCMGIIGRLNRTGELLFWRRIIKQLVPGVSHSDSNFYESLTCDKALKVAHDLGYQNHPVIVVNDNDVAVKMINNAETSMKPHVARAVESVHEMQANFKPIRARVVGRIMSIQDGVDILSKSGQPGQTKYKFKHVLKKVEQEVGAFPLNEKDEKVFRNCK